MILCFCFWNEFKRDNIFSAMFCFCFSSRENPPLGMLTEARLNLDTRSGKSKEIQLKVWKKWNKGKRKICHRSFTLDKSAGLERKTTEGSKTAKNILFFWTSVHFLTRRVGWLRGLWFWCVWRFYQLWPHNNSIFQISQKKSSIFSINKTELYRFFPKAKPNWNCFAQIPKLGHWPTSILV